MRPKRELQRIVRRPDGVIALDPTGRMPGRGAYICDQPACLEAAVAKGALGRSLKTKIPAEFRETLAATAANHTNDITELTIEGGARGQE